MTHQATPEQVAIVDAFRTQGSMVVEAGAGTGKTTTLKMLAHADTTRRGVYIAYNKSIADEASGSFPRSVECRTAHSLAFRAVGVDYSHRLNGPRIPPWEAAKLLGITQPMRLSKDVRMKPWQVARLVNDTIQRFCYSADSKPSGKHVPNIRGAESQMPSIRETIVPLARRAWDDIADVDGALFFTHDYYLKLWALRSPRLEVDYVLLDEAQDANPVIAQLVENQTHAQQVMVGDASQSIYQWRGATDALTRFNADHRLLLSQSFRFGPAVAEEANKWLDILDANLRLTGFDAIPTRVAKLDRPDTILCRTNAQVIAEALEAQELGVKVAIVGGTKAIQKFAEAALDLQAGKQTNHPELVAFETWDHIVEYAESPEGSDLLVNVRLVEKYGAEKVIKVANGTVREEGAQLIVSTAHKAKGREWNNVRIAHDFREPMWDEPPVTYSRPESMLAYVAVTRAMQCLDRGGLKFVDRLQKVLARQAAAKVPAAT